MVTRVPGLVTCTLVTLAHLGACAHHKAEPVATGGSAATSGPRSGDKEVKPFDATKLVSPIAITVEEAAIPADGPSDCAGMVLRFHVKDGKGADATFDYGTITGMAQDAKAPGPLAATDNAYVDHGVYCAGLRQGYTVNIQGDTLVAVEDWTDEESGDGKATKVIAKFPHGATVTLK